MDTFLLPIGFIAGWIVAFLIGFSVLSWWFFPIVLLAPIALGFMSAPD